MPPEHEHRLSSFLVQLLEEYQRFLSQAQAAFLITVDDVERVLPPIGVDVVFFERSGEHFLTGVIHADTEGLEYLFWLWLWLLLLGLL